MTAQPFRVPPELLLTGDDLVRCRTLCATVHGYSGEAQYQFFRTLLAQPDIKNVLILGVYHGRDMAFLMDIAKRHHPGRVFRFVGVDKFEDTAGADWPAAKRGMNWEAAGFGKPPSITAAIIACQTLEDGAATFEIVPTDDAEFLAKTEDRFDAIYFDTTHDKATVLRQIRQSRRVWSSPATILCGDDYSDESNMPGGSWGVKSAVSEAFSRHEAFNLIWTAVAGDLAPERTAAVAPSRKLKILFANPPWFEHEHDTHGRVIRGGIRAGSRWPFTRPQPYVPGRFAFGSYLPFPFFLASAARWAKARIPDAEVTMRDSIARGETYTNFFRAVLGAKPDVVVIETGAAALAHDREIVRLLRQNLPGVRIALAGPVAAVAAKETPDAADAFFQGEYEKNVAKFVGGASGLLPFDLLTREEMNSPDCRPLFDPGCELNYWDACPKGQQAPHLQMLTSRGCPHKCLTGETLVNTVEGMKPIRELVGREGLGVFTYDPIEKRGRVCTATNIRKYGDADRVVRVHFDDGSHIDCTPDHRFLAFKWGNQHTGEKEWQVEAQHLTPGTHLRALKTCVSGSPKSRYITAAWARRGRDTVHRLVAEWKIGRRLKKQERVHHIDENRLNNHPDNIKVCENTKAHFALHPEIAERMRANNPAKNGLTPQWRENISASLKGRTITEEQRENYRRGALLREANKRGEGIYDYNHRVVRVEELPGEHETFCMTVPETHWFYANNVLVANCCFCAWPATMTGDDPDGTKPRSVRFHSGEWVAETINEFRARNPSLKSVYFDDDTFNLSDKHVIEVCAAVAPIGLPWSAMCRADSCSKESWLAMRDAGCFGVKLGFESGSQRVVDEIVNKRLNLAEAAETAIWLREIGMSVHGTFTVGLPGETAAERRQTEDFIAELYKRGALDTHQLSGTATIEGTPLDRIANGETLRAYPGATQGGDFVRDADGVKRLEVMS